MADDIQNLGIQAALTALLVTLFSEVSRLQTDKEAFSQRFFDRAKQSAQRFLIETDPTSEASIKQHARVFIDGLEKACVAIPTTYDS